VLAVDLGEAQWGQLHVLPGGFGEAQCGRHNIPSRLVPVSRQNTLIGAVLIRLVHSMAEDGRLTGARPENSARHYLAVRLDLSP
jgi:hypothetical protein